MFRVFGYSVGKRILCCRRDAGFTLLEVLIVIAIIAGLFALSFSALRSAKERAAIARAKSELALLANALEEFKRLYGDYPQTGPSAPGAQRITTSTGPHPDSAPAIFFNALIGAYGPHGPNAGRLNGPMLIELSKLALECALDTENFTPTGTPPTKSAVRNAFVDPWGNRYLYFYRTPGFSMWDAPAYVLYSAGPDGETGAAPSSSGTFAENAQFTGANADNIYAGRLQ